MLFNGRSTTNNSDIDKDFNFIIMSVTKVVGRFIENQFYLRDRSKKKISEPALLEVIELGDIR